MGLTDTVQESLTQAVTQDVTYTAGVRPWVSLHSQNPGDTGAYEVTTGSGDAGRQQSYFLGADGTDSISVALVYAVTSATVTWIGYWTAQTDGTFLGGFPLIGAGTILAAVSGSSVLTAPGHGLSVDNVVKLYPMPGPAASAVPAGFTEDVIYEVVSVPDADHIELSASPPTPITPGNSAACGIYLFEGFIDITGQLTFPASTGLTYVTAS